MRAEAASTAERTPPARVFFALWPDLALVAALHDAALACAARCGGRVMQRDTLHLTLAFLGDVPPDRLDALRTIGDGVRAPATEITLDRLGYWPHNRIVWAGASKTSDALAQLVQRLGEALGAAGFRTERRSFAPHVTLLRNVESWRNGPGLDGMPTLAPLTWRVDRFVLARSQTAGNGAVYRPLAEWPLQ